MFVIIVHCYYLLTSILFCCIALNRIVHTNDLNIIRHQYLYLYFYLYLKRIIMKISEPIN